MTDDMAAHARLSDTNAGETVAAAAVNRGYTRLGAPIGIAGGGDGAVTAPLAGGGFVLVWLDGAGAEAAVTAQLFDAGGAPLGLAFRVGTSASASEPSVAALTDGGFAVAWTRADAADGSGRAVVAQAFDASGAKVGAETLVNTGVAGDQHHPRIAALLSGGYAVAWDDAEARAVKAQMFSAGGEKAGGELTLFSDAAAAPAITDIARLSDGRLLATYETASGTGTILKGQILAADGVFAGPAFEIDALRASESDASIAALATGGFLLVWTRAAGDASGSGVFAGLYDASGKAIGVPFPVNTVTAGEQGNAVVRPLADGGFVVTWTSAAVGAATGELRAQLFDAAGDKTGAEFVVASGALPLGGSVSVLADGAFVVGYDNGAPAVQLFAPATDASLELTVSKTALSEVHLANTAFATVALSAGATVGASYSYAIVADSSGGAFRIDGDRLYVVDSSKLDYETQPNLSLTVRVTDGLGNSVDRAVSLQLTDAPGTEARYNAGAQFSLSATAGTQIGSTQAALPGGGFVAVWTGQDGSGLGARVQLFDSAGNKQGAEIAVNAANAGSQVEPRVAVLGTGFVVTWSDGAGDEAGGGIKAQLFDASGAKAGAEFGVNTTTAGTQNAPDIDRLAGGGFVVAWADASGASEDTALRAIRAQRFDDAGNKLGGELLVNSTIAGDQFGASVIGLAGGGFVVSWTDRDSGGEDTGATAVHAQIFDAAGTRLGGEILVPMHNSGVQAVSSVVALTSGNFIVAWHSNDNGADYSVKAQMFDALGARIGGEFRIETSVQGDQLYVAATALPDGGFAISWEDYGGTTGAGKRAIVAQMFDASANRIGDEFVVNALSAGTAYRASGLTVLANGDLVASWTDTSKVYGRVFTAGGAPAPAAADAYATDEARAVWGRLSHAGEGTVTEVNGVAASVGERILLASGAALVLRADGSFSYDPTQAFGHLVAVAPTGYHQMAFATSATDSFTYTIGGVVHEATVAVAGAKSSTDTYYGNGTGQGVGHDFLPGTTAAERLMGGTGNDHYTVNHVGDLVVELPGEGVDTVSTTLLYYRLTDQVENLTSTGSGDATLVGNTLGNVLTGGPGADLLYGGGGNDTFKLTANGDTAIGGTGDDLFVLATGGGYSGYSSVVAAAVIVGGGGNDVLRLHEGSRITNLVLTDGGPVQGHWLGRNGSIQQGHQRIEASGISNIQILTGPGDVYANYSLVLHDQFTAAGTTLTIEAAGLYDGESLAILDYLNYETDAHLHVTGGRGADDISGGAMADILSGGDGDDRLDGGLGDDRIDGGSGNDNLHAAATGANGGTKAVIGGSGTDRLHVSFGAAGPGLKNDVAAEATDWWSNSSSGWIDGGNGNRVNFTQIEALSITGSDSADQLAGTSGDDVLDGRGGADRMEGGFGADRYHVDSLDDMVVEVASDWAPDEVHTTLAAYTLATFVEKLVGTSAAGQALTGNGQVNTIVGGVGNDILHGGGVPSASGGDTLAGGKGNDVYLVTRAGDVVQELVSEGTDEVRTSLETYTLAVNVEKLTGTASGAQTLRGNTHSNTITAGAANDRLEGLGGNDILDGGAGADTMIGGTANDVYIVDDAGDVVVENAGEGFDEVRTALASYTLGANVERLRGISNAGQTLQGHALFNDIHGAGGNDQLTGGDGDDTLTGNGGDDMLVGGSGIDTMRGGSGNDIYVADVDDKVIELAGDGQDEVQTAAAVHVLAANVEVLRAASDSAHDFRGNGGDNLVVGGDGNDVIRLQDGGSDSASGRNGVDSFYFGGAFDGGDTVDGGDNRDSLILQGNYEMTLVHAATGKSSIANIEGISLLSGSVTQFGQSGTNLYSYNLTLVDGNAAAGALMKINGFNLQAGENFTLDASAETDAPLQVFAGFGLDTLTGGQQGDAFIFGHDGRFGAGDTVNGGGGYDVVYLRGDYAIDFNAAGFENAFTGVESIAILTSANNEFAGGGDGDFDYSITWADALLAAGTNFTVNASRLQAHETFTFDGSRETNGALRVFGGASADTLTGGGANDQLHGGGGGDVLRGGAGADLFRYSVTSDSNAGAKDVIQGFVAGTDRIDLNRIDAKASTSGANEAFAFIGSDVFAAAGPDAAGQVRAFKLEDNLWRVEGDVNGDGIADLVIDVYVEAGQPLTAADFIA